MDISNKDTIAAISTPLGEGGIGVVRLSGTRAVEIADRVFRPCKGDLPSSCKSHTVHYGSIKNPEDEKIIDEVLLTLMRGPGTYTAEDVIEINCHGGVIPLKKVLDLCLTEGARLAEPGEFTRRAFLNGRIDLSQAEAVLDVIKAETDASCDIALRQLKGVFSSEVRKMRDAAIDVVSSIELTIDFSQEDVEFPAIEGLKKRVNDLSGSLDELLKTSDKGMVMREGAGVVICGRPNVGKSSLMNALLKHERVIVTPIAGTTRDVIEESINIAGVKVRLSDTAGIIETRDRVEIEGIKRSRQKLADADVVIFMVDNSQPLSDKDEEIFNAAGGKRVVVVANKTDLPGALNMDDAKKRFGTGEVIGISALKNDGLEKVEDAIAGELFAGDVRMPDGPVVTNLRHKTLLEKALECVERGKKTAYEDYNGELLSSDITEAVHQLGLIIGESVDDAVLDRIFSQFCIGK